MADESVGKISLDLEVKSDLEGQAEDVGKALAKSFEDNLQKSMSAIFDKVASSLSDSMRAIQDSMSQALDAMTNNLEQSIKRITQLIKNLKIKSPVQMFDNFDAGAKIPQPSVANAKVRAPPVDDGKTQDYLFNKMELLGREIGVVEDKLIGLRESLNHAFEGSDKAEKLTANIVKTEQKLNDLRYKLDQVGAAYDEISNKDIGGGQVEQEINTWSRFDDVLSSVNTGFDNANQALSQLGSQFKSIGGFLSGGIKKITNLGKGIRGILNKLNPFSRGVKDVGRSANSSALSFGRLTRSLIVSGLVMSGLRRGIRSLASSLWGSLKANDQFNHSLNQIKTNLQVAFMPIYSAALPALNALMSALVTVTSYIANFINALFGTTYSASQATAQSLNTATGAVKDYEKALKEAVNNTTGLDELNVVTPNQDATGGGSGGGGNVGGGLVDGNVTNGWDGGLGDALANFFKPFKNAWDVHGEQVMRAMRYAMTSIWDLTKSIGRSWNEVWQNGTGELTCSLILQILTNVFNIVGNLASQFDKAWNSADVGTSIVQGIWDIINSILAGVRDITGLIADWSASLDFEPMLKSIDGLLKALLPLIDTIMGRLAWAFENVLLPFGKWVIEDALPAAIYAVGGAFELLNEILLATNPIFAFLWDYILQPIASWTGGLVVSILNGIGDALRWIASNEIAMAILAGLVTSITLVTTALIAYKKVVALAKTVTMAFAMAKLALSAPIVAVVAGIAALIAILILLVNNFDWVKETALNVWNTICEWWGRLAEWFKSTVIDPIVNFFTGMWSSVTDGAKQAWEGIKQVFSVVTDWFKNIFTNAWQGVKNVFSSGGAIFEGIKDGILNGLKAVINALIKGINAVIAIPFNGINAALNKMKTISILGVSPFGWLPNIGVPSIPMLAQGGYVEANTPQLAIIGDNRHQGEVVAPEDKLFDVNMRALKAFVGEQNGDGTPESLETLKRMELLMQEMIKAINAIDLVIGDRDIARANRRGERQLGHNFNW